MHSPQTSPMPPDAGEDLRCPLCDYNLRGLVEPRCPECGHAFDWAELRFRRDHVHRYVFEHHPRRAGYAFVRTLVGSLRPARFWSELRPTHHTRRGRIVGYAIVVDVLATVLAFATCVCMVFWWTPLYVNWFNVAPTPMTAALEALREVAPTYTLAYLLAWPWLTLATYAIFLVSLGRARIRFDHVLRCAAYSGDVAVWVAPMLVIVLLVRPPRVSFMVVESMMVAAVATCGLLWMAARLVVAAKVYLNFRQSVIMALLTQVIVLGPAWILWASQFWFWYVTR